jgi:hypothetical protein
VVHTSPCTGCMVHGMYGAWDVWCMGCMMYKKAQDVRGAQCTMHEVHGVHGTWSGWCMGCMMHGAWSTMCTAEEPQALAAVIRVPQVCEKECM